MSESMNPDLPFSLPSHLNSLTIGTSPTVQSANEGKKVSATYRDVVNQAKSITVSNQEIHYHAAPAELITPAGKSITVMIKEAS